MLSVVHFALFAKSKMEQFIGYLCRLNQTKSKTLKRILNNEWVTLTAQIHSEYNEAYDKTMPILTAIRIEKSEPPKEQLVYF